MASGGAILSPESQGEEEGRDPRPNDGVPGELRSGDKGREWKGTGESNRRDNFWSEVPEEDRSRLRDTLRQLWSDPAVINAR